MMLRNQVLRLDKYLRKSGAESRSISRREEGAMRMCVVTDEQRRNRPGSALSYVKICPVITPKQHIWRAAIEWSTTAMSVVVCERPRIVSGGGPMM